MSCNVENFSALENMAAIICATASAKFVEMRNGRVFFSPDVPGQPPIESLPIGEFSSRNVRFVLKAFRVEGVEVAQ